MTASFPSDLFSLVAEHHSFRTVLLCDGAPFLLNYFTLWLHEHHLLQNCSPLWLSTISCRTVLLYLWLHHPLWLSIILSELIYLVMERHSFRNVLPCDWTPSPAELFYLTVLRLHHLLQNCFTLWLSIIPSGLFYLVTACAPSPSELFYLVTVLFPSELFYLVSVLFPSELFYLVTVLFHSELFNLVTVLFPSELFYLVTVLFHSELFYLVTVLFHSELFYLVTALFHSELFYLVCHNTMLGLWANQLNLLHKIQNAAARIVTTTNSPELLAPVLRSLYWLSISKRIEYKIPSLALPVRAWNCATVWTRTGFPTQSISFSPLQHAVQTNYRSTLDSGARSFHDKKKNQTTTGEFRYWVSLAKFLQQFWTSDYVHGQSTSKKSVKNKRAFAKDTPQLITYLL